MSLPRRSLLGSGLALTIASTVRAQVVFPSRPIRMIVPYAAGGGSDMLARALGERLSPVLGQPVVVENRPGAGATLGADAVAKAAPDGHTLLLADMPHAISASLYPNLPYRAAEDFRGITLIGAAPLMLFTRKNGPYASLASFLEAARANPGAVTIASGGNGTATHLYAEILQKEAGVQLSHIPYRGSAPGLTDLVAGHVAAAFTNTATASSLLQSGDLRILAIAGDQRLPEFSDAPTFREAGVEGITGDHWFGVIAPARVPDAVAERLAAEIATSIRGDALAARLRTLGLRAATNTPRDFDAFLRADIARWATVVRDANIRLD
jgi:tripartite-type tricarboxylate transporter receptor subunit TctC